MAMTRSTTVQAAVVALSVAWLLVPATAEEENAWPPKMPKSSSCPECALGTWTCPYTCNPAHIARFFDASDVTGNCWQQTNIGDHGVAVEVDFRCHTGDQHLTCDSTDKLAAFDTSFMRGCRASVAGSDDLFVESCQWQCKEGRPVQRCEWTFDPSGRIKSSYGALEACWVVPKCWGTNQVEVAAVCRPSPAWKTSGTVASEIAAAGINFTEAIAAGRKAEYRLAQVRAAAQHQGADADDAVPAVAMTNATNYSQGPVHAVAQSAFDHFVDDFQAVATKLQNSLDRLHSEDETAMANQLSDFLVSHRAASQQLAAVMRGLDQASRTMQKDGELRAVTVKELVVVREAYERTLLELKAASDELAARAVAPLEIKHLRRARSGAPRVATVLLIGVVLAVGLAVVLAAVALTWKRRTSRRNLVLTSEEKSSDNEKDDVVTGLPATETSVVVGMPVSQGVPQELAETKVAMEAGMVPEEACVPAPSAELDSQVDAQPAIVVAAVC